MLTPADIFQYPQPWLASKTAQVTSDSYSPSCALPEKI
jgi:hypothetical protein